MSTTEYSALDMDQDVPGVRSDFREAGHETGQSRNDDQSFGQMIQDAKDYVSGEGGRRLLANLSAQARDNPLPLALVGVGLAWLLAGGGMPHLPSRSSFGRGHDRDDDHDDQFDYGSDYEFEADEYDSQGAMRNNRAVYAGSSHPDYSGTSYGEDDEWTEEEAYSSRSGGRGILRRAGGAVSGAASGVSGAVGSAASGVSGAVGSAAGGVADAASSVASGIGEAVGSAAEGIGSAASHIGRTAYSAAGSVASGARYGGYRAYRGASYLGSSAYGGASDLGSRTRRALSDAMEADPLIVAGLGIAAGAALGALLPRTRVEDEYLGETRDHLVEEAEQFAREKYEQGKSAAQEALRTAKSEASTLVGTGEGSIVGKVSDVARATYERVREGEDQQESSGGSGAQTGTSAGQGGGVAGATTAASFGETGSQGTGQTEGGQSSSSSTGGAL
jgi:hypothetical protein